MNLPFAHHTRQIAVIACVAASACRNPPDAPGVRGATSAAVADEQARADVPRALERLRDAELRRDLGQITEGDLTHRDVRVRTAASRAMARIGQDEAFPFLARAVHDEDATVVSWAAFGLGLLCKGRAAVVIPKLAARAASLAAEPQSDHSVPLDPWFAITDALARCGSPEAERVLRSWLVPDSPAPHWASLALGRLATRAGRLDDETLVALADAASRASNPLSEALYPFSRLGSLEPALAQRVRDVASSLLERSPEARANAIRALGRGGESAGALLEDAVADHSLDVSTRATAARELAELGASAKPRLEALLSVLDPGVPNDGWLKPEWSVFESVIAAIEPPINKSVERLVALAGVRVPEASGPVRRRAVWVRCRAASILADAASLSARLLACDPDEGGRQGALAQLVVLGRRPLVGDRLVRWRAYAEGKDPVVRQYALRMMTAHPEIPGAAPILAEALRSAQLGTVAAAAETLTLAPARGSAQRPERGGIRPDPAVADAITAALDAARPPDALEVTGAIAEAAGAMQLLAVKPRLEGMCKTAVAGLRERLGRALGRLSDRDSACDPATHEASAKAPPIWGGSQFVTLEFSTDVGLLTITLDAGFAPAATQRVVDLVESGFYSGIAVHRMIPGFVVQFGDPGGDGYGGAGLPPLPSEPSPLPFQPGAVGLALSGRDSGSSQLFVTLGASPHLDGDYPLIGRAGAGWNRLVVGDSIQSVRVVRAAPLLAASAQPSSPPPRGVVRTGD